MSFPNTRLTLIQRIAAGPDQRDWRDFLSDYWMPVCRFALRQRGGSIQDAEDVAAETFEVLWKNQLLGRWAAGRSAKLRTLLCGVVRKVLANRGRVREGRRRLMKEHGDDLINRPGFLVVESIDAPVHDDDAFYAAWADDVVQTATEALLAEYNRSGKGDYFRVLYGRICDEMKTPEIASALGLARTRVENYYKHARRRLGEKLEELVRRHVERYGESDDTEGDFAAEWAQLGDHLQARGGLESAVRRAYQDVVEPADSEALRASMHKTLEQLTDHPPSN